MTDKNRQTSEKYRQRPSPPFHADAFRGEILVGNDGKKYKSVKNAAGIFQWKPAPAHGSLREAFRTLDEEGRPVANLRWPEPLGPFIDQLIRKGAFKKIGSFPVSGRVVVACTIEKGDKLKKATRPAEAGPWAVHYLPRKHHWDPNGGIPQHQGAALAFLEKYRPRDFDKLRWSAGIVPAHSDVGVYAAEYFANEDMVAPDLRAATNDKKALKWVKGTGWKETLARLFYKDEFKKNWYVLSHGALFQAPEMRGRFALFGWKNKKLAAVFILSLG